MTLESVLFLLLIVMPLELAGTLKKPPRMVETMECRTNREAQVHRRPTSSHTHQLCFPQWYSILMTAGWQIPMLKNTAAPTMIPLKFISSLFKRCKVRCFPENYLGISRHGLGFIDSLEGRNK